MRDGPAARTPEKRPGVGGRVVLAQADATIDHFAGLDALLHARGLVCERLLPDQAPVRFGPDVRVVVVKDTHTFVAGYALEQAARAGAVRVLLMDGIVEWRNTFLNPRSGRAFLRPAPVDVVACAGDVDQATLAALGNDAVATGLPRLGAMVRQAMPAGPASVMVATANQPAFDERERAGLAASLLELREAAAAMGLRVIWRLTGGLDAELGVPCDRRPLAEALADVNAVVTTPSTLMVEGMLAGRPTALLHPHPTPLWQPCVWVWNAGGEHETDGTTPPVDGEAYADLHRGLGALTGRVGDARTLLRELLAPTAEQIDRQAKILGMLHRPGDPAARLAALCAELAQRPRRATHARRMASLVRVPARRPARPDRPRVVNIVHCEGSPVGGVTTWAARLADAFAADDLGYDVRTLLITGEPHALPEDLREKDGALTSVCVYDPMADHVQTLRTVRGAVEALEPSIVLPNYTDLAYMVAMQLRARGVRTVAAAHTDDGSYRALIGTYDRWDGAVGVSEACRAWLEPMAAGRPVETIVYGVPVSDSPRTVAPDGPLKIAYCGRMVQEQKRIFDLLEVIEGLERRAVAYELHMVGDGLALDAWRRELGRRTLSRGRAICHGRRDPAWVQAFLPTMDVSVLVSDYEGTSVSMLEAMGAGVVPAVTRVSGVDAWVRDGQNGIVSPPRSPDAMAARLAELAADRAMMARLGREAWETARARASVAAMARRYAGLFDAVLARPMDRRPTDLGLRPTEPTRWRKAWAQDESAAEAYIDGVLRESGYRRIAPDRPEPGCDAVLVRASAERPDAATIVSWRAQGLGVAVAPALETTPLQTLEERVRSLVAAAVRDGARRVAVYGIGQHTRRLAGVFSSGAPFVGFIDDRPPAWGSLLGLPVVTPDRAAAELAPDAVLLSSDAWEARLWERCEPLRRSGVRVIPVYGTYEEAPAAAAALAAA